MPTLLVRADADATAAGAGAPGVFFDRDELDAGRGGGCGRRWGRGRGFDDDRGRGGRCVDYLLGWAGGDDCFGDDAGASPAVAVAAVGEDDVFFPFGTAGEQTHLSEISVSQENSNAQSVVFLTVLYNMVHKCKIFVYRSLSSRLRKNNRVVKPGICKGGYRRK